jgi:hypothetical protein
MDEEAKCQTEVAMIVLTPEQHEALSENGQGHARVIALILFGLLVIAAPLHATSTPSLPVTKKNVADLPHRIAVSTDERGDGLIRFYVNIQAKDPTKVPLEVEWGYLTICDGEKTLSACRVQGHLEKGTMSYEFSVAAPLLEKSRFSFSASTLTPEQRKEVPTGGGWTSYTVMLKEFAPQPAVVPEVRALLVTHLSFAAEEREKVAATALQLLESCGHSQPSTGDDFERIFQQCHLYVKFPKPQPLIVSDGQKLQVEELIVSFPTNRGGIWVRSGRDYVYLAKFSPDVCRSLHERLKAGKPQ